MEKGHEMNEDERIGKVIECIWKRRSGGWKKWKRKKNRVNLIELLKRKEFWMLNLSLSTERFLKLNKLKRLERSVIVNEEITK
jgi:hypothetical protein